MSLSCRWCRARWWQVRPRSRSRGSAATCSSLGPAAGAPCPTTACPGPNLPRLAVWAYNDAAVAATPFSRECSGGALVVSCLHDIPAALAHLERVREQTGERAAQTGHGSSSTSGCLHRVADSATASPCIRLPRLAAAAPAGLSGLSAGTLHVVLTGEGEAVLVLTEEAHALLRQQNVDSYAPSGAAGWLLLDPVPRWGAFMHDRRPCRASPSSHASPCRL